MTKVAAVKAESYDTQVVEQAMAKLLIYLSNILTPPWGFQFEIHNYEVIYDKRI